MGLPRVRLPDFRGLRGVRQDADSGSLTAVCAAQAGEAGSGRQGELPASLTNSLPGPSSPVSQPEWPSRRTSPVLYGHIQPAGLPAVGVDCFGCQVGSPLITSWVCLYFACSTGP